MKGAEAPTINNDDLIKELGGCGLFQALITPLLYAPYVANAFSSMFMSFGSYNSGWRCMDNDTTVNTTTDTTIINGTQLSINNNGSAFIFSMGAIKLDHKEMTYESEYHFRSRGDSCSVDFESCENIQFNPAASTIVTEWGLICDRKWIISLIISIQMCGTLTGTLLVGYFGDRFGRKNTMYSAVLINAILLFVSIFSNSWQMFTVLRFAIGVTDGITTNLPLPYITEFVTQRWRAIVSSFPMWATGTIILSCTAMGLKDWRLLHIVNVSLTILVFLPVFWVPESMRWLMVKGKEEKTVQAARKIARVNNKTNCVREEVLLQLTATLCEDNNTTNSQSQAQTEVRCKCNYLLDLFKRNFITVTIIMGFLRFSNDLIFYVTSFGISGMPGNFYLNMIILSITDLSGNVFAAFLPNVLGRKWTLSPCFIFIALSQFGVVAVDFLMPSSSSSKAITTLVLVVVVRSFQNIAYCVLAMYINELYPTVRRSTANGYAGLMGSLGSILAPYLIPGMSGTFYVSYVVMAILALVCGVLVMLLLPETKGRQLQDVWNNGNVKPFRLRPTIS